MAGYEIVDHEYDVVVVGAGGCRAESNAGNGAKKSSYCLHN